MDIIHSGFIFADFECVTIHLYSAKICDKIHVHINYFCTLQYTRNK